MTDPVPALAPFEACRERDRALAEFTTVRVGGPARWLYRPRDAEEVARLLLACDEAGLRPLALGGGSNLLACDEPITRPVLHPDRLDALSIEGPLLRAGAGVALSAIVAAAAAAGLAGAHNLAGIPGQLGGALVMNAGGRWGDLASMVHTVEVRTRRGEALTLRPDEIGYGYRSSRFPEGAIVVAGTLRLEPGHDPRELKRESGRILKAKNAAQPTRTANFGCTFKNPEGHSAGVLVEQAGLKGLGEGGALISPLHGNFIENPGEAKASDIRALIERMEGAVWERFAIRLEREVRVWEPGAVATETGSRAPRRS